MILFTIQMKVLSAKRMELSQTIVSLSVSIRMEKGCRHCDFYQSLENENQFFLLEEWDTKENLRTHLDSNHFKVLKGVMKLLQEPCEMLFHTVSQPEWIKEM